VGAVMAPRDAPPAAGPLAAMYGRAACPSASVSGLSITSQPGSPASRWRLGPWAWGAFSGGHIVAAPESLAATTAPRGRESLPGGVRMAPASTPESSGAAGSSAGAFGVAFSVSAALARTLLLAAPRLRCTLQLAAAPLGAAPLILLPERPG
jgi:hypothetical protein